MAIDREIIYVDPGSKSGEAIDRSDEIAMMAYDAGMPAGNAHSYGDRLRVKIMPR